MACRDMSSMGQARRRRSIPLRHTQESVELSSSIGQVVAQKTGALLQANVKHMYSESFKLRDRSRKHRTICAAREQYVQASSETHTSYLCNGFGRYRKKGDRYSSQWDVEYTYARCGTMVRSYALKVASQVSIEAWQMPGAAGTGTQSPCTVHRSRQ